MVRLVSFAGKPDTLVDSQLAGIASKWVASMAAVRYEYEGVVAALNASGYRCFTHGKPNAHGD